MSKEKYYAQPPTAQSHFSAVPAAEIERSTFDRSHGHKTTFNAGKLIPIFVDEVLPGDTFDLNQTAFVRLSTPLKPIMDNLYFDTHYFFVPYRLVWEHWEQFMGQRDNPTDDPSVYSIPQTTINLYALEDYKLANHFGLPRYPTGPGPNNVSVSALPFRAYTRIWNEHFRDENLQTQHPSPTNDGPDTQWNTFDCLRRGKRHDYFTSCLPWPQKGSAVYVPLGNSAPIVGAPGDAAPVFKIMSGAGPGTDRFLVGGQQQSGTANQVGYSGAVVTSGDQYMRWKTPNLLADLTTATAMTINDLRTAFQIQRLLERDARGGTRYIEIVLSHFGVHSDDARLQRPEYLGGNTTLININPVASTFHDASSPQANLSATGQVIGKAGFEKSFTEHGIIIGVASVRADLTYQQGIERFWQRKTRYNFYWPALAHLGEQAVTNVEILATGIPAYDNTVFGYQERYAEYRYKPSRITGKFSSADPLSLDMWHVSQELLTAALNATFIEDFPPIERIVAVPSEPHFLADIWFSLKCTRPMPVYSVPGLIDHF